MNFRGPAFTSRSWLAAIVLLCSGRATGAAEFAIRLQHAYAGEKLALATLKLR